jgi:NTP pyrophosphatase (non-canonical NTP hydrolase)
MKYKNERNYIMNFSLDEDDIKALQRIQYKCYGQSKVMGWHNKSREFGTRIALCHSELSEALEGYRKDLMDDHLPNRQAAEVELADLMIRVFDLCGLEGYDLAGAIAEKHDYNAVRADHKLENRMASGGKKF